MKSVGWLLFAVVVACIGRKRQQRANALPLSNDHAEASAELVVDSVGVEPESCPVELSSETRLRTLRGCYTADRQYKKACATVKTYRQIKECCNTTTGANETEPAAAACWHMQQVYVNYCVYVPSYVLTDGCPHHTTCSQPFASYIAHAQNLQRVQSRQTAAQCTPLQEDSFLGAVLPRCYEPLPAASSTAGRQCLSVKRTLPSAACCSDNKDSAKACAQFDEVHSTYCFDARATPLLAECPLFAQCYQ